MNDIKRKTYSDSYLYNIEGNKHNAALQEFIINAERIDNKKSPEFIGIVEEVKRIQRSNVLYTLLMSDNVVLCIGKKELPRAFKVFFAKDLREGKNARKKVFIDVTSIITLRDGYYNCKNIQYFIAYLFEALCYYLYNNETTKILNNSVISLSGAEAYTSMVCYIIDYMRIIGYEYSKDKIAYLTSLFYLHTMLGKDLDQYSKNIAAKIAGINNSSINTYDLYFKESDFENIDTFITMLSTNFKLKGLTTEVFVGKWNYTFSPSALYACEVFTSFAGVICAAYSGSYVVNQKQIERCCASPMIKFATEMLRIGTDSFAMQRGYREAFEPDSDHIVSKETQVLKEAIEGRKKIPDEAKFSDKDYESKTAVAKRTKELIKWYISVQQQDKISGKLTTAFRVLCKNQYTKTNGKEVKYEQDSIEALLREGRRYFNIKDKKNIKSDLEHNCGIYEDRMKKARDKGDKNESSRYARGLTELRRCVTMF